VIYGDADHCSLKENFAIPFFFDQYLRYQNFEILIPNCRDCGFKISLPEELSGLTKSPGFSKHSKILCSANPIYGLPIPDVIYSNNLI